MKKLTFILLAMLKRGTKFTPTQPEVMAIFNRLKQKKIAGKCFSGSIQMKKNLV